MENDSVWNVSRFLAVKIYGLYVYFRQETREFLCSSIVMSRYLDLERTEICYEGIFLKRFFFKYIFESYGYTDYVSLKASRLK